MKKLVSGSGRFLIIAISLFFLCAVTLGATEGAITATGAVKNPFDGTFGALIPPLLAITLALITKEVCSSLFFGILFGSCLVARFKPFATIDVMINSGLIRAVMESAGIFIFLVVLGTLVAFINRAGIAVSFGEWAKKHIHGRTQATLTTFGLGLLVFIDDYFNCLTVGSVMPPVTDNQKISRAKLAYLIDSTAAPVCMIAPLSTWAAAVSCYAAGTNSSGLELFIKAIPFNFYSFLTFIFVITLTLLKMEYGPMVDYEYSAQQTGNPFCGQHAGEKKDEKLSKATGNVFDLVVTIIALFIICCFALAYGGGFFRGKTFPDAISSTNPHTALPWGGVIVLVFITIYMRLRKVIRVSDIFDCVTSGFHIMSPAILILTFATALKNITGILHADVFVAGLLQNSAEGFNSFLPAVVFLISMVLAFATGTSWGTFGILIPIVINVFPVSSQMGIITISACLAGAVCGDHCSPLSDTTIMSSASARCELIIHVTTQLPYALTVAGCATLAFIVAGFTRCWILSFSVGVVLVVLTLAVIKLFYHRNPVLLPSPSTNEPQRQ